MRSEVSVIYSKQEQRGDLSLYLGFFGYKKDRKIFLMLSLTGLFYYQIENILTGDYSPFFNPSLFVVDGAALL